MLSIENPPDPSCPSNLPAVKSHERASEKIALQEAGRIAIEDNSTPNFSIRDYVLGSRSKCIEASWPFPQQLLQLCLKHGAKDLLPPFEPPDLVRSQSLRKAAQPAVSSKADNLIADADPPKIRYVGPFERKPAGIQLETLLPLEELITNSSDPARESSSDCARKSSLDESTTLDKLDAKITSTVRAHLLTEQPCNQNAELGCSVAVSISASSIRSELVSTEQNQNFDKQCKPLEKKCRLKVKLRVTAETNQVENGVSNSSTVSDPMASKVCPVCKTFSSTSNTTLNAHMDQCLFMDTNSKSVLSEVPKIKVKQRKKRLMTDIYMTAPHGTLEDLDRRNGTNWAVELALLAAPTSGTANETKRPKLSTMECVDDVDDSAVYVDSSGMKVRILSKFNAPLEDELNMRKHAGVEKTGKTTLNRNKKSLASKYLKNMKVKAQRKKLSFRLLKRQFIATLEEDPRSVHHMQNDPQPNLSHGESQVKSSAPSTLRQWACSTRSDTPKQVTKSSHINLDSTLSADRSIMTGNNQSDPYNSSAVGSELNKISRPSDLLTGSPKMKRVECFYSDHNPMIEMKRKSIETPVSNFRWSSKAASSANSLKLFKTSDTLQSAENKSVEIDMSIQDESEKCSSKVMRLLGSCPSTSRGQITFSTKKNILVKRPYFHLEGSKGEASERASKTLKFRKHRSILRTCKRGPPYLLPMSGMHGTGKNCGLNITRKNRSVSSRQCVLLNNFTRRIPKAINQESPSKSNRSESDKQESSGTVEEQEYDCSNTLQLRSRCHDTQIEDSEVQVDIQKSGDVETVGDTIAVDFVNSDNLEVSFSSQPYSCPSADDVQSISGSEVHVEHTKKINEQRENVGDDICYNEMDHQDIQMAVEAVDKGVQVSCAVEPTECQAESPLAQDSTGCLTSHGDAELQATRKSPSINSFVVMENNDKYLSHDSGQSGSGLSTGSTISLPCSGDSKLKGPETTEPSPGAFAVQDSSHLASQTAEHIEEAEQENYSWRNEEIKENMPVKVSDKGLDDQPFCCSCGESISKDSQLLRHSDTSRRTKGNQMSNLFIGPRTSSSFSTYQSPRTINMANSMKISMDSAARYSTCIDFGSPIPSPQSQNQSISNPILRLMGKNLMVVNNEQLVPPQTAASDYAPKVNTVPPGFASISNLMMQESSHNYHQLLGGCPAIAQAIPTGDHQLLPHLPINAMGAIPRAPLHSGWRTRADQRTHQKKTYIRPNSPFAPYMMDEVIVIDESHPQRMSELKGYPRNSMPLATSGQGPVVPRSFSCYPSESQTRNISSASGALYSTFPTMVNANFMNRRFSSEGQSPLLPSPSNFQSPTAGQVGPSFYYPPILRRS